MSIQVGKIVCSYCGCRSIDLISRLSVEHEEIVNATSGLRSAAAAQDRAAAAAAARQVAQLLNPHAAREELGIFSELRADEMFTEYVDTLCEEHDDLDAGIEAIVAGDLGAVEPFVHLLQDHIDKEEVGLFPAAVTVLTAAQLERLHADLDAVPTG